MKRTSNKQKTYEKNQLKDADCLAASGHPVKKYWICQTIGADNDQHWHWLILSASMMMMMKNVLRRISTSFGLVVSVNAAHPTSIGSSSSPVHVRSMH